MHTHKRKTWVWSWTKENLQVFDTVWCFQNSTLWQSPEQPESRFSSLCHLLSWGMWPMPWSPGRAMSQCKIQRRGWRSPLGFFWGGIAGESSGPESVLTGRDSDEGDLLSFWLPPPPRPGTPGAVSEEVGAAVGPEAKSSELAGN